MNVQFASSSVGLELYSKNMCFKMQVVVVDRSENVFKSDVE